MGRSVKDLRRRLSPITGLPTDDAAMLQAAVPGGAPAPLAQTIKQRAQQLRAGNRRALP